MPGSVALVNVECSAGSTNMLFSRARARLHALRSTISVAVAWGTARIITWLGELERGQEDPFVGPPLLRYYARRVEHPVDWGRFAGAPPIVIRGEPDGAGGTVVDLKTYDGFVEARPGELSWLESRRNDYVRDQVLRRLFIPLALAWKNAHLEASNLSMLPHDAEGIHWPFAGPIMAGELWMTQFILIAVLGVEPALAIALGKRILNEWHDLEPEAGLTDDEKTLLGLEREEQRA